MSSGSAARDDGGAKVVVATDAVGSFILRADDVSVSAPSPWRFPRRASATSSLRHPSEFLSVNKKNKRDHSRSPPPSSCDADDEFFNRPLFTDPEYMQSVRCAFCSYNNSQTK